MVARMRYQQTKIDGAPETILVGADVVQIIREQQAWVREHWGLGPDETVRYLFPKLSGNRKGTRAWTTSYYDGTLRKFSAMLDLRDSDGRELSYSRSHRLRHTKATTLLNAGAPIHVVQRYLGHRSPEMTMRYAATLATTAEREFLAMVKIGRDGRQAGMDRRDMLDILQLDRRTDRILPNGYCLLPPVRSCDKGNACHGCDHFATDRSHLPEIRRQLAAAEQLIRQRQEQHAARYGEPMSDSNIWLEQRHAEIRSMQLEISALEALGDNTAVVRGPGVCGRALPGHRPREHRHRPQAGGIVTSSADDRRAAALRQAAQAKRQAAVTRAETAIRTLVKGKQDISFRSVARVGGVSLNFLYGNDDLRSPHREAPGPAETRPVPDPGPEHADGSDIVHILTEKLRLERDTRRTAVSQLEEQLAAAHGELLGSAASSSSTASAPPDHVADAVMNVMTCGNSAKICSNAR